MGSLFPYYGGKFNQLRNILEEMGENRDSFDLVVDVFGGSAKVILNIPDEWKKLKVYNNLDMELYVTFKVLQSKRKNLGLSRRLRVAFQGHDAFFLMRNAISGQTWIRLSRCSTCRLIPSWKMAQHSEGDSRDTRESPDFT